MRKLITILPIALIFTACVAMAGQPTVKKQTDVKPPAKSALAQSLEARYRVLSKERVKAAKKAMATPEYKAYVGTTEFKKLKALSNKMDALLGAYKAEVGGK